MSVECLEPFQFFTIFLFWHFEHHKLSAIIFMRSQTSSQLRAPKLANSLQLSRRINRSTGKRNFLLIYLKLEGRKYTYGFVVNTVELLSLHNLLTTKSSPPVKAAYAQKQTSKRKCTQKQIYMHSYTNTHPRVTFVPFLGDTSKPSFPKAFTKYRGLQSLLTFSKNSKLWYFV